MQVGCGVGVGDDGYLHGVAVDSGYGEGDALDGDGALGDDVLAEVVGELEGESPVGSGGGFGRDGVQREQGGGAVDVALDDVAAERRACGSGELQVDDGAGAEMGKRGAGDGLGGEVGGEGSGGDVEGGEADSVDGDAIAEGEACGERWRVDGDAGRSGGGRGGEDGSGGFDEASEHSYRVLVARYLVPGVGCWPGVVEVAGYESVLVPRWSEGLVGGALEGLLEEERGGNSGGEGECVGAEFGLAVEEDGFVDEVLVEEGSVEVRAGFQKQAEDVAFGQGGEDGGQAEAAVVAGDGEQFGAGGLQGGYFFGGGGRAVEDKQVGLGGVGEEEVGVERGAEVGVQDDAEEWTAAGEAGAVGEGGVVGEDGADAGEDGVGGVAEELDLVECGGAGEPMGLVGGAGVRRRGELAVDGEGGFEGDEGPAVLDEVGEGVVEVLGLLLEGADGDFDACIEEAEDALSGDEWIGIAGGDDDAGDAGGDEGVRARASASVVGAGFKGDVGGSALGCLACVLEGDDLGVVALVVAVGAFGDDLAVLREDAADLRIGRG